MSNPWEDSSHEVLKIFSLSGDQLVGFLKDNGFSSEVCQMFTGMAYLSRFIIMGLVVFTSLVK